MSSILRSRVGAGMAVVASLFVVGCSGEAATPIDLSPSTTVAGVPATADHGRVAPEDDINAESRQMAIDFAEQQCFDDVEADEGVIRIVDPETEQVVGEVIVDCREVRSNAAEE